MSVKGGPKTGGRRKGSPNKATLQRAQVIAQAVLAETLTEEQLAEVTPLAALLRIMRAELRAGDHAAAKVTAGIAAPYVHARLTSTDLHVSGSLDSQSDAEIEREVAEVQAKLQAVKLLN